MKQAWHALRLPLGAIGLALLIGAILLALSGANPVGAYGALLQGAFGGVDEFGRTLEKSTPLIFSGLAVAFAFKAGLFNIGGQGQLLIGALVAGVIGFAVDGLPPILHLPLAFIGGALAGGLYGMIPGALKAYTGAHEVITTIMLNYIAINFTEYLADGPLKDAGVIARTPQILKSAELPDIALIPIGFLVAIVVAALTWWLLQRTTIGYEIRTVGQNPQAAQYAGMKVAKTILLTMFLSGLLAGMGGSVETLGVIGRFQPGFNSGLGFDGITIALLSRTNPFGVIAAALLVGALRAGSSQMQFSAGVSAEIIDVILALMLFFVSADIIVRRILFIKGDSAEKTATSSGWGQK